MSESDCLYVACNYFGLQASLEIVQALEQDLLDFKNLMSLNDPMKIPSKIINPINQPKLNTNVKIPKVKNSNCIRKNRSSWFLEERVHSCFLYNTVLFRKMRNNVRLFPFCQVYTRRSCICNKSITHTQTNRPNSSFRKNYVSRLLQYTFHFYSDFNFCSKWKRLKHWAWS